MAEFLIKAVDATHKNPIDHWQGCYKKGDPVTVQRDGHTWGREECLPKFIVLKVPSMSIKSGRKYTKYARNIFAQESRRKYKFDFSRLSNHMEQILIEKGFLKLSYLECLSFIKDKNGY